jgi:uncharacterized protein YcnI
VKQLPALLAAGAAALLAAGPAAAHPRLSPPVSVAGALQLYSLAVPTEKANATTTKVVLTVPPGFGIDSFVPSPGWTRVERSWTGGRVPTGEDALFQFLAEPARPGTYAFRVEQTYSDGEVVDWADPETGESPAPTIAVERSLGGGSSTLAIVALAVGAVGILVGGIALATRGGRPLA